MACARCNGCLTRKEADKLGLLPGEYAVRKYHASTCPFYRGETHPSGVVPEQHTRAVAAGNARVKAALAHLEAAREALNAACRDLCSVIGAREHHRVISRLSVGVETEMHDLKLDQLRSAEPFKLGGEVTDRDVQLGHGCGLEDAS